MDFYGFTLLLRWILGWFIQPKLNFLPEERTQLDFSVIIPARNEEKSLPRLLKSIKDSNFQPVETIVVDDHSTDQTYQVAKSFGASVISAPELEEGWTGKNFALNTGIAYAKTELVLLIDADVQVSNFAFEKLLANYKKNSGLISVQPFHQMSSFYERFASVFNLIGAIGARLGEKNGLAFGPVMLFSKNDLSKIGGLEKVNSQILEDRALGIEFIKNSINVHTFIGKTDFKFQMYPEGIKSLIQGFTKNMAAGSAGISKLRWTLLFTWFSGLVAAAWELPFAFLAWPFTQTQPSMYQYILTIAYGIQFWIFVRKLGNFNWYLIFYPIMIIFFLIVFFYSVIKTWQGKVIWKDRVLDAKKGLK